MHHQEYRRLVPGAKTAVMFIHGIVGTPNHFRDMLPLVQMVSENCSVHNLLLDGHGKGVEDFSHSSMQKWKTQVWGAFDALAATHEAVVIVAHSMGTLFAIQLGAEFPEKVRNLFLLAVPLRPWPRLFGVCNMLRLVFHRVREDRPLEMATRSACGITTTRKLWQYLAWIPRYLELFAEIPKAEKLLPSLQIPVLAFQSGLDELVSGRSCWVLERSGTVQLIELRLSTHFYYAPGERERVLAAFEERMKKHD